MFRTGFAYLALACLAYLQRIELALGDQCDLLTRQDKALAQRQRGEHEPIHAAAKSRIVIAQDRVNALLIE